MTDVAQRRALLRGGVMRTLHRWWKGVGAVPDRRPRLSMWWWGMACLVLLGGCNTLERTLSTAEKVAHAGADSISILRGPVEDVNSVWKATLGGEDAAAPATAPAK